MAQNHRGQNDEGVAILFILILLGVILYLYLSFAH